jgi:hypothetical protein
MKPINDKIIMLTRDVIHMIMIFIYGNDWHKDNTKVDCLMIPFNTIKFRNLFDNELDRYTTEIRYMLVDHIEETIK